MRATVSTGALPSSRTTPAQTTSGGRAVAAARREGRSPALVVQDIETSPPTFIGAPRPKTSDSTTSGRGGPPSTVARLPVPGSRRRDDLYAVDSLGSFAHMKYCYCIALGVHRWRVFDP